MSPSAESGVEVSLVEVGEDVLERLLAAAIQDADPDEVTPPLGGSPGWNPERISWFRHYHRAASGLDGPAQEKSWAVSCDGKLAGSIRLRRTAPGTVETGIWLGRSYRGRGIAREALRRVLDLAAASGCAVVEADTTAGNGAALALLRGAGADLVFAAASGGATAPVKARIPLG